jgi:hypothetical protein
MTRSLQSAAAASILSGLGLTFLLATPTRADAPPLVASRDDGGKPHYRMTFEFTRANTIFPGVDPGARASPGATFKLRDGGQFEVEVRKADFPIPAPKCASAVIVRMPWTDAKSPQGPGWVAEKQALFAKLDDLRQERVSAVVATLDLAPYVRATANTPTGLELSACNVFFRDVRGRYVDLPAGGDAAQSR